MIVIVSNINPLITTKIERLLPANSGREIFDSVASLYRESLTTPSPNIVRLSIEIISSSSVSFNDIITSELVSSKQPSVEQPAIPMSKKYEYNIMSFLTFISKAECPE